MSYVQNGMGDSLESPTVDDLERFLAELDPEDLEHGAAWIEHERGHTLEYSVDGRLVYNHPTRAPRHLTDVTKARALELWLALIEGRLSTLEALPWKRGSIDAETAARYAEEAAIARSEADRRFYESLGPELPGEPCRHPGCPRDRIELSVLCRDHHFENLKERKVI